MNQLITNPPKSDQIFRPTPADRHLISNRQCEWPPASPIAHCVDSAWPPIISMRGAGKEVDRFWVKRLAERNTEKPALRQVVFLEQDP
jgi:hypothetical protein